MMHDSLFGYLKPTDKQLHSMDELRDDFFRMLKAIEEHVPEGRYRALAITHLEMSAMFANKGIMRDNDGTPRG